ncbi:MAG: serine/threonine-protein kinase [Myxococcota bacterium]
MGVLQPGDEIDIWVVDRALGQGGMGSVYRCHNREAKRILAAVKVLDAAFVRLPSAKARFVREAEILFSLDHPGIVKVRNVRMDVAMPYLEMEFIDGVNLETRAREGALSAAEAVPLFVQVADALAYLHGRGIRHRDVKPSNLVIQANGVVKLVDFGIATEADGATITERGQTFGSVSYVPPEWLDPERIDPVQWDIYSAGVVFYELLTGRQAFPMTAAGSVQQQVVRLMSVKQHHPPLDPGPQHPARLRALVRDMTHAFPEARIADAEQVRRRLAAIDFAEIDLTAVAASMDASAPTWFSDAADGDRAVAGVTMVPGNDAPRPLGAPSPEVQRAAPVPPPAAPAPLRPSTAPRIAVATLGLAALVAAGSWAYARVSVPPTRQVRVDITGLADDAPVAVTLAGFPPAEVIGRHLVFEAVPTGPQPLRAAIGEECTPGGDAPAWCGHHAATLDVVGAHEPLIHALALAPPPPRVVTLVVPGIPEGAAPVARVDGGEAVVGTSAGLLLAAVTPGRHRLTVAIGSCTDADLGCATDGVATPCTPGCSSWSGELVVPAGEGDHRAEIAVPAPIEAPTTRGASARRSGGIVTVSAFARWLSTHPEWTGDSARAAGKADAGYLSGWSGAEAPAGKGARAVVDMSWAAASAYCAGRGGLLAVDAPPLTWTDSATQPWHEYRASDGRPAWRRDDGAASTAVEPHQSSGAIGFRCAR